MESYKCAKSVAIEMLIRQSARPEKSPVFVEVTEEPCGWAALWLSTDVGMT